MKRGIILFFSFLFSCLLNAQLSIQQDTIRYVMANLNLREAPNTTSAIITQIPKGTRVTVDEICYGKSKFKRGPQYDLRYHHSNT